MVELGKYQETIKIEKNQKERSRELIRHQYTESDRSTEWYFPNLKERSLWYPEYSIQYNTATENNR